jgi:hypothetical protein
MYLFSYILGFRFAAFFPRGHTLHVSHLCLVLVLFSFLFFGVFLLMNKLKYTKINI